MANWGNLQRGNFRDPRIRRNWNKLATLFENLVDGGAIVLDNGQITLDPSAIDHGDLSGLGDDDHTQYHNDARGDARYFQKTEFLDSSAGAGDSGKPVKLDADGNIDASMIDDADIDHGSIGGLGDDDHTQYLNTARHDAHDHSTALGSTVISDISNVDAGSPNDDDVLTYNTGTGNWEAAAAAGGGATSLDDLDDVNAASPSDNDILRFDSGTGDWETEALPDADISSQQYTIELTASSTESFADSTVTDIPFDTESADPNDEWDTTNFEFTADAAGLFFFFATFRLQGVQADMTRVIIQIRRDTGGGYSVIATDDRTIPDNSAPTLSAASRFAMVSNTLRLSAGDKIKFTMFFTNVGGGNETMDNNTDFTRAIIQRISD